MSTIVHNRVEKTIFGLGGWLIPAAIALICAPCFMAFELSNLLTPENLDLYKSYFEGSLELGDYPTGAIGGLVVFILMEILTNLMLIGLSLFLLYHFFKKSRTLPKWLTAFLLVNVILQIADLIGIHLFPDLIVTTYQDYNELACWMIMALIWIPYFKYSKRVKETFVQ